MGKNGTDATHLTIDFQQPVPLFPLPNMVLLPSAITPLHLFEPRFKDMASEAVAGSRLIAMALLRSGYQERYYTHHAAIHPIVCLGRVVRSERLDDGRYNILLQGVCRAKVSREDQERSFRRAWLTPVTVSNGLSPQDEQRIRERIVGELDNGAMSALCVTGVLRDVVQCPHLSVSDMIDLIAHHVIESPTPRQRFLAEADVVRRAACLIELLARVRRKQPSASPSATPPVAFEPLAYPRIDSLCSPSAN